MRNFTVFQMYVKFSSPVIYCKTLFKELSKVFMYLI